MQEGLDDTVATILRRIRGCENGIVVVILSVVRNLISGTRIQMHISRVVYRMNGQVQHISSIHRVRKNGRNNVFPNSRSGIVLSTP